MNITTAFYARMHERVIKFLLALTSLFGVFMFLVGVSSEGEGAAAGQAISRMAIGLIIIWIFIVGVLMYRFRDRVKTVVQNIPLQWQIKFVLFATILACLEEAVTVSMTNLAPLFGSVVGEAAITASSNYFDVIFFHSVIVFIPLFIAWAIILRYFDFSPFAVFMLFGFLGIFLEASFIGPLAFIGFPMWMFVYGLMIYLPAYCLPTADVRGARPPKFWHYFLSLPMVLLLALPLLLPIVYVITQVLEHPRIHF